jgi:hypothetical protein
LLTYSAPPTHLPPQGHYDQKIVNPNEFNAPVFSFPKGHFPRDPKKLQPGPGAYKITQAVGKQVRGFA